MITLAPPHFPPLTPKDLPHPYSPSTHSENHSSGKKTWTGRLILELPKDLTLSFFQVIQRKKSTWEPISLSLS